LKRLALAVVTFVAVIAAALVASVRGGAASAHRATFTACLVIGVGGQNDRSLNHLAYVGLLRAEQHGVMGRVIRSTSWAASVANLRSCAQTRAGLTIGVGYPMLDAIDAVASSFPKSKFAIVDVDVTGLKHKPKNVEGLLFKEQEAGYLVGYAAGLWAKAQGAKAVGSVGGIKIPPVDRYIAGFQYGARKADPGLKTLNDYSQDFDAQSKCKEKALNQVAHGSVVEFEIAGQCGLGVLEAARTQGVFAISADADPRNLGPWVMTSALKRVDTAVLTAIEQAEGSMFRGGRNEVFGAQNDGVGYGTWSRRVPASIRAAVAKQFALLKVGKIKGIPTTVE
jgi:basic membrane protein A